jgi:hypothetical protein
MFASECKASGVHLAEAAMPYVWTPLDLSACSSAAVGGDAVTVIPADGLELAAVVAAREIPMPASATSDRTRQLVTSGP